MRIKNAEYHPSACEQQRYEYISVALKAMIVNSAAEEEEERNLCPAQFMQDHFPRHAKPKTLGKCFTGTWKEKYAHICLGIEVSTSLFSQLILLGNYRNSRGFRN